MNRPTSDAEIREACPGIRTWLYRDLARLEETGEFPQLPIAVLYETSPGFGHWVGLIDTPEGIEHFDPYGLRPDAELRWVPRKYREAFKADSAHMVRLLMRMGRAFDDPSRATPIINFNEYRLQARKPYIATCGRWVALRCRNKHMSTERFAREVRQASKRLGITPDELVVKMVPL